MNLRVHPPILWLAAVVLLTLALLMYSNFRMHQRDAAEKERYEKYQREVLGNLRVIDDPKEIQELLKR